MGEFGTDSFLVSARKEDVPCRFCGKRDGDGHLFWGMFISHTLQHVRELPEFAYLMSIDRSRWPRCLLWHGWLPGLKGGLVNLGVETVVFPQGCPLSMVFIVAIYVPWCRHLDSLPDVKPQLSADKS